MPGMFGGYEPQSLPPLTVPQFPDQPAPQPKKHGMFGGGFGKFLTNFILNYSAAQGNPASMSAIAAMQHRKLEEMRAAQEEQSYQRQRQDGMQDWIAKQEYEAAHPQPHVNDTVADYEFIRQQLGDDAAKRFIETKTNPIVMTPYGPMPYSAVAGGGQAPAKPVGKLVPIDDGGPTPQASGGFPRPY